MGKRVDFSARTVITPDPNLRIDQVSTQLLRPQRPVKALEGGGGRSLPSTFNYSFKFIGIFTLRENHIDQGVNEIVVIYTKAKRYIITP